MTDTNRQRPRSSSGTLTALAIAGGGVILALVGLKYRVLAPRPERPVADRPGPAPHTRPADESPAAAAPGSVEGEGGPDLRP